jgi:pimeloyl-ACP methyl ester carboxylesterase
MPVEGFVTLRAGLRTWFRVDGDLGAGRVPLLCLHGGPGMPSDALEPLAALALRGRPVVIYDQIGCGRSDRPRDRSLWCPETFVQEVAGVRRSLGLKRVHLLGWSWGGMLALESMLRDPGGVVSLTLASAPASAPLWSAELGRLRDQLPHEVRRAMHRYESHHRPRRVRRRGSHRVRRGTTTARAHRIAIVSRAGFDLLARPRIIRLALRASAVPGLRRLGYEAANVEFVRRHVMRGRPRDAPLCIFRSFAGMNRDVYETMWGPAEYFPTGVLKDWDVTARLGEIAVPTLLTSGRYDETTPAQMEVLHRGIRGARWELFDHSAHAALVEEQDRYIALLEDFLGAAENGRRP